VFKGTRSDNKSILRCYNQEKVKTVVGVLNCLQPSITALDFLACHTIPTLTVTPRFAPIE